jgi:hypothetical protein
MKAVILAAATNCILAAEAWAQPAPDPAKEVDSYLNSLVAENKLSGVVLVAKNGVTIASKAAGIANKATNAPIDLNTKFNLGSMNKMFTAVAIGDNNLGGKRSVGHNGGFPGIAANFEMFPESGYTAVELMNTDPPAMMPIAKAIRELIPAK